MLSELEIPAEHLEQAVREGYALVDIRSETSIPYGMIPKAVHLSQEDLLCRAQEFAQCKGVIVYCTRGQVSLDAAEELRENGVEAFNLKGGYLAWLMHHMRQEQDEDEQRKIVLCNEKK